MTPAIENKNGGSNGWKTVATILGTLVAMMALALGVMGSMIEQKASKDSVEALDCRITSIQEQLKEDRLANQRFRERSLQNDARIMERLGIVEGN